MTTLIDSSVVLRYCFQEGDLRLVHQALVAIPATSVLALVEVPAAIHARFHRGAIGAAERAGYLTVAQHLLASMVHVGITAPIRGEAVRIASHHLVRTLDAIHVATAAVAARRRGVNLRFCTADIRQADVARSLLGAAQVDFVPPLQP